MALSRPSFRPTRHQDNQVLLECIVVLSPAIERLVEEKTYGIVGTGVVRRLEEEPAFARVVVAGGRYDTHHQKRVAGAVGVG